MVDPIRRAYEGIERRKAPRLPRKMKQQEIDEGLSRAKLIPMIITVLGITLLLVLFSCIKQAKAEIKEPDNLRNALIAEDTKGDYKTYLAIASVVHNRLEKRMGAGLLALKRKDLSDFVNSEWWYAMNNKHINLFSISQKAIDEVFKNNKDYANGATHYEHTGRYKTPKWANKMKVVKIMYRFTKNEITFWKEV